MALNDFKKQYSQDSDLNRVQDNVAEFTRQLKTTPLDGVFLMKVLVNTTTTQIPHGLTRTFKGWQIIDIQGDSRVWRDATEGPDLTKFLPLKASASVTVSLWVF